MSDEGEAYRVGRGRPPRQTRFAPGKSGNPRGRPKGRKSIEKMLNELLDQKVTVGVGDRRRSVTRLEAILMHEPPRLRRRPFGLSQAAIAGSSSIAK